MDFGFYDWLGDGLKRQFALPGPRDVIPIVLCLGYDHLWDGLGTNNPVCWDVIAAQDLEATCDLFAEVLQRLSSLAARINGLAVAAD